MDAAGVGGGDDGGFMRVHPRGRSPKVPGTTPYRGCIDRRDYHFDPQPSSVRAARRVVALALRESDWSGDVDTVLLLASELVTNAVRHAATPFDLTVTVDGRDVEVAVVDHDRRHPPKLCDPAPEDTHGRGLRIVEELSADWGTEALPGDAKRVWFRVS